MGEFHDWLSQQHHGLKTYKAFRQTLIDRASSDTPIARSTACSPD